DWSSDVCSSDLCVRPTSTSSPKPPDKIVAPQEDLEELLCSAPPIENRLAKEILWLVFQHKTENQHEIVAPAERTRPGIGRNRFYDRQYSKRERTNRSGT